MKTPAAQPQPFNPNQVAPMGSLGDDFDGRIPSEVTAAPRPAPRVASRPRQRHSPATKAPVLAFSTVPLGLLAIAVLGQPLGQELRSLLAFLAVLLAIGFLLLLNTKFRGARGSWRNYLALALAVPFLALPEREHLDRPLRQAYLSRIQPMLRTSNKVSARTQPSGLAQRRDAWATDIDSMRHHMRSAGELAGHIILECSAEKTLLVGGNARVSPSPQWAFYEYVPTLNLADDCAKAYLERSIGRSALPGEDLISGVPSQLRDRFSPEGKWPYGVHRKGELVLVWSPGPDGRMDFSPLKEFREDDSALAEVMLLKSYDPTNGMLSSGDLMEVVPLPKPEELGF